MTAAVLVVSATLASFVVVEVDDDCVRVSGNADATVFVAEGERAIPSDAGWVCVAEPAPALAEWMPMRRLA